MTPSLIFLVIAVICFIFEALGAQWSSFRPKWWAFGVAAYLASLAAA